MATRKYHWVYPAVTPSVEDMTPYEEIAAPAELKADCEAVNRRLEQAGVLATRPAPSIHYDDQPRETGKREIQISEAAQRLANALHLHLD